MRLPRSVRRRDVRTLDPALSLLSLRQKPLQPDQLRQRVPSTTGAIQLEVTIQGNGKSSNHPALQLPALLLHPFVRDLQERRRHLSASSVLRVPRRRRSLQRLRTHLHGWPRIEGESSPETEVRAQRQDQFLLPRIHQLHFSE